MLCAAFEAAARGAARSSSAGGVRIRANRTRSNALSRSQDNMVRAGSPFAWRKALR